MRAAAKAALLFAFGRVPGGAHLYRTITRLGMGTQATHVDKLARVWPGYCRVLTEKCGIDWAGKDLWIHEGGWTVLPVVVGYLLTGKGACVTNCEGRISDRYTRRSLEFAAGLDFPIEALADRKAMLAKMEGLGSKSLVAKLGGHVWEAVHPSKLPLEPDSADICHTGGTLEHYRPDVLRGFIAESYRVLRPGGVASHVFDHRDHLFHADRRIPFLNHLRFSERTYAFRFGHPLLYHNRLLPADVVGMFEAEGFQTIAVRRLVLPNARYVETEEETLQGAQGIPRESLAVGFRRASDADLHTAAAHYLFRKPKGDASPGLTFGYERDNLGA